MAILDPFESWRNSRIQVVVSRWILLSLLIIDHFLGLVQINLISVRLKCIAPSVEMMITMCKWNNESAMFVIRESKNQNAWKEKIYIIENPNET